MAATDEQAAHDTLRLPEEEMLRPDDATDAAAAGPDAKPSGLKALSNIEPGWSAARTAVVLVDATVASSSAVQWAVQHWRREGDAVHIVHAVCCLLPKLEVYHSARWSHDPDATMLILPGGPGNAFKFQAPEAHHERADVLAAQAFIERTHLPFVESVGVPYEVHMFVDTLNAPPDAIGGTVLRVAEQLGANIIVTTTDCYASASAGADNAAFSKTAEWLVAQRLPIVFIRPPATAADMELDQPNAEAAAAADALAEAPPEATLTVV